MDLNKISDSLTSPTSSSATSRSSSISGSDSLTSSSSLTSSRNSNPRSSLSEALHNESDKEVEVEESKEIETSPLQKSSGYRYLDNGLPCPRVSAAASTSKNRSIRRHRRRSTVAPSRPKRAKRVSSSRRSKVGSLCRSAIRGSDNYRYRNPASRTDYVLPSKTARPKRSRRLTRVAREAVESGQTARRELGFDAADDRAEERPSKRPRRAAACRKRYWFDETDYGEEEEGLNVQDDDRFSDEDYVGQGDTDLVR
ncbi:unnamed protein product [Protopolystoma xenopodis]|uniref:Uncharacterized protein n=1 Tax=Protopolystoma xenopodis TaxID=117903 RepID=A0A8J8RV90_9PLAT|nr:unnamed protein product [Protopolystoma xenopodis]